MTTDLSHLDDRSAGINTRLFVQRNLDVQCPSCDSPGVTVRRIAKTDDGFTIWFDCAPCGTGSVAELIIQCIGLTPEDADSDDDDDSSDNGFDFDDDDDDDDDPDPEDEADDDGDEIVECSSCKTRVSIEAVNDDGECAACVVPPEAEPAEPVDCKHPAESVEDGICALCGDWLDDDDLAARGIAPTTDPTDEEN
jgi:hypothetical protein